MKLTRSAKIAGSQDFYTHGFQLEVDWEDIKGSFVEYGAGVESNSAVQLICLRACCEQWLFESVFAAGLLSDEQAKTWDGCCIGMRTEMHRVLGNL